MTVGPLFFAPGAGGGAPSSTVSLLHLNGSHGSTTYTDATGKTWTGGVGSSISTAESLFGGASLRHTLTTGQGVVCSHPAFEMGTGDYTIEFAFRPVAVANNRQYFDGRGSSGGNALSIYAAATALRVQAASNNVIATIAAGTWYRVAFARESGTLRSYVNGVLADTQTDTRNWTSTEFRLGETYTGSQPVDAYIDEFRATKGVALYTGASYTLAPGEFAYP